jgi:hypothetical protein
MIRARGRTGFRGSLGGVVSVGKQFRIRLGRDSMLTPERAMVLRNLLIDHGFERSAQSFDRPFTASGHR